MSVFPPLYALETSLYFFLICCVNLGYHRRTRVTDPDLGEVHLGGVVAPEVLQN